MIEAPFVLVDSNVIIDVVTDLFPQRVTCVSVNKPLEAFPANASNSADGEAAGLEKLPDAVWLVALEFDRAVSDGATATARLFGGLAERHDVGVAPTGVETVDDDDNLTTASGFLLSQNDTPSFRRRLI
jgi:hypothetical protein